MRRQSQTNSVYHLLALLVFFLLVADSPVEAANLRPPRRRVKNNPPESGRTIPPSLFLERTANPSTGETEHREVSQTAIKTKYAMTQKDFEKTLHGAAINLSRHPELAENPFATTEANRNAFERCATSVAIDVTSDQSGIYRIATCQIPEPNSDYQASFVHLEKASSLPTVWPHNATHGIFAGERLIELGIDTNQKLLSAFEKNPEMELGRYYSNIIHKKVMPYLTETARRIIMSLLGQGTKSPLLISNEPYAELYREKLGNDENDYYTKANGA